jgi:hypothetical protein
VGSLLEHANNIEKSSYVASLANLDIQVCSECYNNSEEHNLSVKKINLRFEIFTAVVVKSTTFWDKLPYSPLKVNRCFGGINHLHLQGRRISWRWAQPWKQVALLAICFHAAFLLCLYFDLENGGDMFLRNVSWLSTDYTALYPRR